MSRSWTCMRLRQRCTSTCAPGKDCQHLRTIITIYRDCCVRLTRADTLIKTSSQLLTIVLVSNNGVEGASKYAEVPCLPTG